MITLEKFPLKHLSRGSYIYILFTNYKLLSVVLRNEGVLLPTIRKTSRIRVPTHLGLRRHFAFLSGTVLFSAGDETTFDPMGCDKTRGS